MSIPNQVLRSPLKYDRGGSDVLFCLSDINKNMTRSTLLSTHQKKISKALGTRLFWTGFWNSPPSPLQFCHFLILKPTHLSSFHCSTHIYWHFNSPINRSFGQVRQLGKTIHEQEDSQARDAKCHWIKAKPKPRMMTWASWNPTNQANQQRNILSSTETVTSALKTWEIHRNFVAWSNKSSEIPFIRKHGQTLMAIVAASFCAIFQSHSNTIPWNKSIALYLAVLLARLPMRINSPELPGWCDCPQPADESSKQFTAQAALVCSYTVSMKLLWAPAAFYSRV